MISKKRIAAGITAIAAAGAIGLAMAAPGGATEDRSEEDALALASAPSLSADFESTKTLTGEKLVDALGIPEIGVASNGTRDGQEQSRITVPEGGDPALAQCGTSGSESMFVHHPDDPSKAYCITGIDTENPASMTEAWSVASRLRGDHVPTDAETKVFYLRMQLMYDTDADGKALTTETEGSVASQLAAAEKQLTPEEQTWLNEG